MPAHAARRAMPVLRHRCGNSLCGERVARHPAQVISASARACISGKHL
jgi:hypothetical protein